jgi:predicted Zn-dependent protease
MEEDIEYIQTITDERNNNTRYMQQYHRENHQYEADIVATSAMAVQAEQDLLSFCGDEFDPEHILPGLAQNLVGAGRTADALRVADECHRRYPKNPYCVAASAEALHKLGRNSEARAAAEQVIRRGPYDAEMEAAISYMRSLLALIDTEEQLRAVQERIRNGK